MDRRSSKRPSYPGISTSSTSTRTSAYQNSASSVSSTHSTATSASSSTSIPSAPFPQHSQAPLPSPTVQQGAFFSSMTSQMSHQQLLQLQQIQAQQAAEEAKRNSQQQWNYQPDRTGSGQTAQETSAYISQYGLLAEAARRAEIACLERDMSGFDLG